MAHPTIKKTMKKTTQNLLWLESVNRLATIRYRGVLLHSLTDPLTESEEMIGSLEFKAGQRFVVGGLGLGYHVYTLRKKYPSAKIFIYEPYKEIYEAAMAYHFGGWADDPGVRVFHTLDTLEDVLIQSCIYSPAAHFPVWWIHPSYREMAPRKMEQMEKALGDLQIRQASNTKTIQGKRHLWVQNIQENWSRLLQSPTFTQLHRSCEGIPALIIGAGPSLAKNFESLKLWAHRGILWASGSVYAWLKDRGIQPDLVCVFESEDVSRQMHAYRQEDPAWMALSSSTHPHHWAGGKGKSFSFHTEKWVADLLDQGPFIPQGGHIASAAFTMAILMGCNPIIFVGQDLSYEGQTLHAPGVRNRREREALRSRRYPMDGQKGLVYGHSAMVAYRSWYEESARYLARVRPDLKIINASEGGVRVQGFAEMPLKTVAELFARRTVAIQALLNRCLVPPKEWQSLKAKLQQMFEDLYKEKVSGESLPAASLAAELYQWILGGRNDNESSSSPALEEALGMVQSLIEKTRAAGIV